MRYLDSVIGIFSNNNVFEKKYPLFNDYIKDETVRNNMLNNEELFERYKSYYNTIEVFIYTLKNNFDNETVAKFIIDIIVKEECEVMVSIMTSYLNSNVAVQANPNFVSYYKKILYLDLTDDITISYVEEEGIVTDRSYRELPNIALDKKFEELYTSSITYNNYDLKEVFPRLSIIEKKFVIKLLKINGFSKFDTIFQKLNISFYGLIKYLCHNKIPFMLFKNENVNIIGEYQVLLFCFKMFDIDANVKIIENINHLLISNRIELIKNLIDSLKFESLGIIPSNEIDRMSDEEVIKYLSEDGFTRVVA